MYEKGTVDTSVSESDGGSENRDKRRRFQTDMDFEMAIPKKDMVASKMKVSPPLQEIDLIQLPASVTSRKKVLPRQVQEINLLQLPACVDDK